jgi:hypothetical protein
MGELFTPLDTLKNGFRFWWWILILFLIGGMTGFGISELRPAVYEATALISFHIDYAQTGQLTDIEEDDMVGVGGDLAASSNVLEQVVMRANNQGLQTTLTELIRDTFTERKGYSWQMRLRHPDPYTAEILVGIWADATVEALNLSLGHAREAAALQRHLDGLSNCLVQSISIASGSALCTLSLGELQGEIQKTSLIIQKEKLASSGISQALSFSQPERAGIPQFPVQNGRGQLMIAGGMIGLLIGIWSVQIRIPERLFWKSRAA